MRRLKIILPKKSGRDSQGHIAVRHQGGRHKRFMRVVDFVRERRDITGKISAIEYDPNRNTRLAFVVYPDGDKRYLLAAKESKVGDAVTSGQAAPIKPGNSLPLSRIPVGTSIFNIEITPNKGGQMVRSGGLSATIQGREEAWILVKLPSGELRRFLGEVYATIGQSSGETRGNLKKAGRKRNLGIRPSVRGVAMHPAAHPHGGGEGRSGEGMPPKTPWGKPARGVRTRNKNKYSKDLIVKRRRP
ncbi:MAG: 50S ribosomal protein L2 [Candidatus Blackburnbacteria bacterium RIFCSPHIGHO2_02_FULL_44_20]|uniref:Large ribosomal subunit protein uL2 n=1 Tax=Candidatus Blackburnbacteria bacterium RIFCSPHIGHO2_02_FULL_44_20 TaxID=1797516 RepID=A0A1G1V985_9BACT|nr:MAG: 50S ribosomal protein L2 [Candidatus Blackburnbacteria bacterium RIFCSPHIGHO2_12_FULL_44_25]OGY11861.1 MAG: 50S ribosomal protein L2 [Candidatus Blackburnbacteria bacterium RIFCSPHIGHO2_02_FULL_44_20]OGY14470.1 MAG: 50S ribosomal protein L2 [Candidatus Blackburnbacteria bacterium RIFCSPLOWO2_01_FULL_44_43]